MLNQLTSNGVLSFSCPISAAYLRSKQPDSELITGRGLRERTIERRFASVCQRVSSRGIRIVPAALVGPGVLSQRPSR